MGGACCLHDTGVQKLTLNMLCLFLTSPGEGRPQHYITTEYLFAFARIWRLSVMQSTGGVEKNVIKNLQFTPKCSPDVSPIGRRFEILFLAPQPATPLPPTPPPFRIGSSFGELIKNDFTPPRF